MSTVRRANHAAGAAGVVLFVSLISTPPALAQTRGTDDRAVARELAADAKDAYDLGDWPKALELYRQASRLVPAVTLRVREARCLVKLNRLVEARDLYVLISQERLDNSSPPAFREAVAEAGAEQAALEREIPRLRIKAPSHDALLRLDGVLLPASLIDVFRFVDPGPHTVAGSVAGKEVEPVQVTLTRREQRVVSIGGEGSSEVASNDRSSPPAVVSDGGGTPRSWSWIATGVAAGGLTLGVGAGLVATGQKSDLDRTCPERACPASSADDLADYRRMRDVSTIGYVIGITSAATAVILFITQKKATDVAVRGLHVALDGTLSGQF